MKSKVSIDCWAMNRRTSESSICNFTRALSTLSQGKDHLTRSSLTYLKDKPYQRAKHYGLSNYSSSSSLITVEDHYSDFVDIALQGGIQCKKAINYTSKNAQVAENNEVKLLFDSMAVENCVLANLRCATCYQSIQDSDTGVPKSGRTCAVEKVPSRRNIQNYKQFGTMNSEHYNQTSTQSIVSRDDRRQSGGANIPPNSFVGIMNTLCGAVIRVIYHIFLIIAQVIPVFEVFPSVYEFVVISVSEIRCVEDRKEVITKGVLLVLQVMVILVTFVFVLCAILIPVFTLSTSVLKRLFFFI